MLRTTRRARVARLICSSGKRLSGNPVTVVQIRQVSPTAGRAAVWIRGKYQKTLLFMLLVELFVLFIYLLIIIFNLTSCPAGPA